MVGLLVHFALMATLVVTMEITLMLEESVLKIDKHARYKINKRLGLNTPNDIAHRVLQREDVIGLPLSFLCDSEDRESTLYPEPGGYCMYS